MSRHRMIKLSTISSGIDYVFILSQMVGVASGQWSVAS